MGPTPDAVMRRWFNEVWNEGREAAIDEMFAPDGVAYGLVGGDVHRTRRVPADLSHIPRRVS